MKLQEKIKAIQFRKQGKSYSEIRKNLKISKSTLSLWLRDVKLSKNQQHRLYVTLKQQNGYRLAKHKQQVKTELIKKIVDESINEFEILRYNELFLPGLMLYWAEGDKIESVENVKFSNSDPAMIQFMMRWFRRICKIPENKFRIALHIHELHNEIKLKKYWSELTGISIQQFHKTQIKPSTLKHRRNLLYNGTCTIRINNRNLFRKIKGWKLGFQQKFNLVDILAP